MDMSIRIYKGTSGFISSLTLVGEVVCEKYDMQRHPQKILVKSGTGIFATTMGSAEYDGYQYKIATWNKSSFFSVKEKTFYSGSVYSSNNTYEAEIVIDSYRSPIGVCRDGKIIDNKNRIVGKYIATSEDLPPNEVAELAAIGAGFLLATDLKIHNRFL